MVQPDSPEILFEMSNRPLRADRYGSKIALEMRWFRIINHSKLDMTVTLID